MIPYKKWRWSSCIWWTPARYLSISSAPHCPLDPRLFCHSFSLLQTLPSPQSTLNPLPSGKFPLILRFFVLSAPHCLLILAFLSVSLRHSFSLFQTPTPPHHPQPPLYAQAWSFNPKYIGLRSSLWFISKREREKERRLWAPWSRTGTLFSSPSSWADDLTHTLFDSIIDRLVCLPICLSGMTQTVMIG